MKHVILSRRTRSAGEAFLSALLLVVPVSFGFTAGQPQSASVPQLLAAPDAFEMLKALNEKEALAPASFMMPIEKYNGLKAENCFGIKLASGRRLAGESSGESYGIRGEKISASGQRRAQILIGFFHAEFPFSLQAKPFPAGSYIVMAFRESLDIHGDDPSETRYDMNRRAQVPKSRVETLSLAAPLPEELFAEKAAHIPRFTIVIDKGEAALTIHGNKLRLIPR
jgi:hypothetical protein